MAGIDPRFMMSMVKGKFGETTRQDLADLFCTFKNDPKNTLVIHFHGGLVDKATGIANAVDLNAHYTDVACCLFPIWETGIQEVLSRTGLRSRRIRFSKWRGTGS